MAREQEKQHNEAARQQRKQMQARIGEHVLHTLGRPGDLQCVQVRLLWENHYRVNVLVGLDAASVKVAHSFFLVADAEGKIIASSPPL